MEGTKVINVTSNLSAYVVDQNDPYVEVHWTQIFHGKYMHHCSQCTLHDNVNHFLCHYDIFNVSSHLSLFWEPVCPKSKELH